MLGPDLNVWMLYRQARAIDAHNVGVEGLDAQLLDDVREVAGVGRRLIARALGLRNQPTAQ
eukprot:1305067-Prymnesium_polylepis.1